MPNTGLTQNDRGNQRMKNTWQQKWRHGRSYAADLSVAFADEIEHFEERHPGRQVILGPYRSRYQKYTGEQLRKMKKQFVKDGPPEWLKFQVREMRNELTSSES